MKKLTLIASGVFLTCITGQVKPITSSTAQTITGLTFVGGLGIVGYNVYAEASKQACYAALGTGLATLAVYFITDMMTPAGRLSRAKNNLERIRANGLAIEWCDDEQSLIERVQEIYLRYDLPLVWGYKDLSDLFEQAKEAISLLNLAKEDTTDSLFIKQCDDYIVEAKTFLANIVNAIKILKTNKEYLTQLDMHKREQYAKEQLAVQQQIAHAQWHSASAQQQMANAYQQSVEQQQASGRRSA